MAPTLIAEETLVQRTRPNLPGAPFETHEVKSAYGFSFLKPAPNAVHEVRKVVSVDGTQMTSLSKARQAMTLGLQSNDDKLKKRLLEDFERHGLRGAATDFGPVILLFTGKHLQNYDFQLRGERLIGADRLLIISFSQKGGNTGITVFLGNTANRERLRGEILVRRNDLVPLRITLNSAQVLQSQPVREESTIDYQLNVAGVLVPLSVVHREFVNNQLSTENQFTYTAFRPLSPGTGLSLTEK